MSYFFSGIGIKSKQHFHMSSADLGHVKASFSLADENERPDRRFILDPAIVSEAGPSELVPPGMSQQRKEYLYNSIRPYVQPDKRDKLCPKPK